AAGRQPGSGSAAEAAARARRPRARAARRVGAVRTASAAERAGHRVRRATRRGGHAGRRHLRAVPRRELRPRQQPRAPAPLPPAVRAPARRSQGCELVARGYHARVSASAATPVPLAPVPAPRFDGWRLVALGGIAQGLALPLLGAYGVVATPLIEEFGASTTQLGLGMSLALLAAAIAGPPLGAALDRGPLRAIMFAGVALMFVSVLALSRGAALWQLGAGFACATVGMSMYGMMPVQVMLVNWFALRRGTALSLAHAGTSAGALIVPTATAWMIEWLGWRHALVALAAGAAAVATLAIARLGKRPEELGQTPDGIPHPPRVAPPVLARGGAGRDAIGGWLRDRNFWLIGAGVGLALSVSVATLFLVRHLETLGIPRTRAALLPSSIAVFGILGKLAAGWLIDR